MKSEVDKQENSDMSSTFITCKKEVEKKINTTHEDWADKGILPRQRVIMQLTDRFLLKKEDYIIWRTSSELS